MNYPFIYYGIITGTRTGSSHFCDLLESTNRLGSPSEYFNHEMRHYYDKIFPNTNQSYLDKIIWNTKKENFVVGVKFNNVNQIISSKEEGMLDKITHWVWLKRSDKLAQAVSRYIAWETDIWDYSELKNMKNKEVKYSKWNIDFILNEIKKEEQWIECFLNGKKYIELMYEEDICENPEQSVVSVLNFLNVTTKDLPPIKSNQKIMRNDLNEKFIQMYLNNSVK